MTTRALLCALLAASGLQLIGAQAALELRWQDVTPGAVVAEAIGRHGPEGPRIILLTEDRRARLYNSDGERTGSARTGLRRVAGWIAYGDAYLLIPQPGSRDELQWLVSAGDRIAGAGRLLAVERVLPEGVRFLQMDADGLLYGLDARGGMLHASLTGGRLWERRLPDAPVSALAVEAGVAVALAGGRLMLLRGDGQGRELVDLQTPLETAVVGADRRRLVLRARDGTVLGLRIPEDAPERAMRAAELLRWTRLAEPADRDPAPAPVVHAVGDQWQVIYPVRDGGLEALDWNGRLLWSRRVPGVAIRRLVSLSPAPYLLLLDGDARLTLLDTGGSPVSTLQLKTMPARTSWTGPAGQLVVTYNDWSVEVYDLRLPPAGTEEDPPRGASAPSRGPDPFGALRARADAVLAGNSEADRAALLASLRSQRERGVLYGRVGEASSILAELLSEAYRAPQLRQGRVVNDFPDIRRGAVAELTQIMDRRSRSSLAEAVAIDPDPRVVADALRAIAGWGRAAAVAEPALGRFRRAGRQGRLALAPALVDLLEHSDLAVSDPAAAAAIVDQLIRSDVSAELRRRAARWSRGGP